MDIMYIIAVVVIVLLSMTIHEAIHGFVSYWLGDNTAKEEGRLTFNPIKHIDPFLTVLLPVLLAITGAPIFGGAKPVPFNPARLRNGEFGAMLVGVAGPLSNLVIAFILFGFYVFFYNTPAASFLQLGVTVNLGFFIFNMIPIPPLDGSRLLYYLAPNSVRGILAAAEHYGIIVVFAVILLFNELLSDYLRMAISFFLALFASIYSLVL